MSTRLFTNDIDEFIKFYKEVLGFQAKSIIGSFKSGAIMDDGNVHFLVSPHTQNQPLPGTFSLDFYSSESDIIRKNIESMGIETNDISKSAFWLYDCDKNRICIYPTYSRF